MHAPELRHQAVALVRSGVGNAEVGRRLGVPTGTVGYWAHVDRVRRGEPVRRRQSRNCPRCDGRDLDRAAYAYLLGSYLGDGYISHYAKHRSPSLQVTCDDAYPGLTQAVEAALRQVFPHNSTCRVRGKGCHHVKVYHPHLDCLDVGGVRKRYEYPRYFFSNLSDDIRQLHCEALDKAGVEWRVTQRRGRPFNVSVARKESVALMGVHLGPKY